MVADAACGVEVAGGMGEGGEGLVVVTFSCELCTLYLIHHNTPPPSTTKRGIDYVLACCVGKVIRYAVCVT